MGWVYVMDHIPLEERAAIVAGTSTFDCTQAFASALKEAAPAGFGVSVVHVSPGTYRVARQQPEAPLIPEPQPVKQPK